MGEVSKLANFPSVYVTSLKESEDRRNSIQSQFAEHGILNLNAFIVDRFRDCKHQFKYSGDLLHQMDDGGIGAVISHLVNIKNWYLNTNEEYAFFCEDDLSLETVKHWNFTWDEFVSNLPSDWECVQLIKINSWDSGHTDQHNIRLRGRNWDDWGATYLIKRDYARKIIEAYCPQDEFQLTVKNNVQPIIENILYYGQGRVYNCPLFVENVAFQSTFIPEYTEGNLYDKDHGVKNNHYTSSKFYSNVWETVGASTTINDIMGKTFNTKISLKKNKRIFVVDDFYVDPMAVRNFALTLNYYDQTQNNGGFIGKRTREQYLFPGLKEAFEEIMGEKIVRWEPYGMNGRFQYCVAGEPLVYHCDDQKWAGMLYLTPNAPVQCGTSTFVHRKSRIRNCDDPAIMTELDWNTTLDRTPYDPVDVIGNVFNRLVIFDARSIHAATEYFGYNIHNSRLWQMFFFD